jgi:hypothetical protein
VLLKNPFREAVEIWPFLLKWRNEDAVPCQMERLRQKYEGQKNQKAHFSAQIIFLPSICG